MSWPSPNDPNTVIQGKQGLEGRGGEGRGRGGRGGEGRGRGGRGGEGRGGGGGEGGREGGREGKEGIVYTLLLAVSTPYLHTLYVNGIE